ncbi:MAG TPA: acyltransferase [Rhodanobacteraceae bacterium]|nr:acyltransferase [Rhodanobacteraceae bacterium]
MTTANRRDAGIDLLRGLCVLLVVLHHVNLRFALNHYDVANLLPKLLARVVFWSGYYAVIVFFVISGFLITGLSLRRWSSLGRIDVRAFYAMRSARIAPCLVALLLVLSVLHLAGAHDYAIDPARASLPRAIIAALTFHFNWLEGTRGYLPGSWDILWSLSIEEAFYVAFPLVCLLVRREAVLVVPLLALIVLGPFVRVWNADIEPWDEYAYLACFDGIAFGCLAALIHARLAPSRRWLVAAFACGVGAMLLIVVFRHTASALGLVTTGLYITVLELGAALVLLAFAGGLFAGASWRGTRTIRAIGRWSYEIYLTHMFVVFTTVALFKATAASLNYVGVWYLGALVASVLLGAFVARWYSEPANAALRTRLLAPATQTLVSAAT